MSRSRIFFIVVAALVGLMIAVGWWQSHQRTKRVAQERAEEAAAMERKAKAEEERRRLAQAARSERGDELRENASERQRLQRRYPEAYEALQMRAGMNLESCVVTATGEMRGERVGNFTPSLRARCGADLDQNF